MKVLFLPTWRVERTGEAVNAKPPNSYREPRDYWFFKHWLDAEVDVIDTGPAPIAGIEKRVFRVFIAQALRALAVASKYNLLISHGAQSGLVLAALRSCAGERTPPHVIVDVGCFAGGRGSSRVIKPVRFALRSVDAVIYHASIQQSFYEKHTPELIGRMSFVPLGVDPEFFKPLDVREENYILSIGYDNRSRDWGTLFEAFKPLSERTKLRVVGLPYKLDSTNLKIEPSVSIDVLKELMARSRMVVLPFPDMSFAFGQTTLLGAMAMGKPVVATASSGVIDYLRDGENCLVAPVGDARALRDCMERLLGDGDFTAALGERARASVVDFFNEERMAGELKKVVEVAISGDGRLERVAV